MVTADQIIALVDAIVDADGPEAIVLFGSYAHGTPTVDSDVDLLVIREYDGLSPDRAADILMKLQMSVRPFPLDLIVRSRPEIVRRVAMRDWFLKEIDEQGITLYARDDAGVGGQGRERLGRRTSARPGRASDAVVGLDLLPRTTVH